MLYMIDNYDSFTYNIYQVLVARGHEVRVVYNDQMSLHALIAQKPSRLLVSPGPGAPQGAGISLEAIQHFAGRIPVLGVCLGHQSLAEAFGAKVVRAKRIMHGKTSPMYHERTTIFKELDSPFEATRYHSLIVEPESLPPDFDVTAWTPLNEDAPDGEREIMAIRHTPTGAEGVQFHPESILSAQGPRLLEAFAEC